MLCYKILDPIFDPVGNEAVDPVVFLKNNLVKWGNV